MAMLFLVRRMLSVVYLMTHPAVPLWLKTLPLLALVYFMWPRTWFGPLGILGDFIVVFVLMAIFTAMAWPHAMKADKRKEELRKDSIKAEYRIVEDDGQGEGEGSSKSKASSKGP